MFKKTAIVASAAAGLLMIGSPAFATAPSESETDITDNTSQIGLINVDDVLSNNQINVCDVLDLNVGALLGVASSGDTVCTNAEATND
ncbi:hypothetical protein [Saccharomonospora piscinae]|uniref:Secreted protein n=1 Tax=Saccharomonospora piscinae TaxID=687388 RepID=A0A1V9A6H2_SACPI|nr:hypothetical protein [Saccharomonospora piscinae]OQO92648.1 hypothetical protein B1813_10815 [Saccharomonospora piscinae]TLW91645.1 hypothetical protein FFT09_11910 [Saccharomonospora piscinae]